MNAVHPGRLSAADLVTLDPLGDDRFRARFNLDNFAGVTFGGQALGQALAAARRTAPDWPANSLGGWFLRGGKIDRPIELAVERTTDSRRFAVRRVVASQDGRAMFDLICSFHDPEDGAVHEFVEPIAAPDPETLPSLRALAGAEGHRLPEATAAIFRQPFPIEIRLLEPDRLFDETAEPRRDFWFRIPSADAIVAATDHEALLALMSDYWLPGAITAPHHGQRTLRSVSSLNHMMWLHAPARTDDWLLYRTDSHWAAHGRGLSRGTIHDRSGRLVATAMQEALVRWA